MSSFLDIVRAVFRSPKAVAAVGAAVKEANKISAAHAKATADALQTQAEARRNALRKRFG